MKAIGLILILITGAMACESSQTNLSNKGFDVQLIEYTKPGKHYSEAVLIIPPIYGTNFIDKSYAKALCRQGIKAIIVHRWSKDREQTVELDMYKRFYKRAQKAIKLTIDANKKYKLGILGTSSGGIHAAIATSRFDEIKTSLLIVSGGNIAAILAESSQKIVSKQRNTRRVKLGLNSSKEYKDALKKHLPFDPLHMDIDRTKKLGMVVSQGDTIVPSKFQNALQRHWQADVVAESSLEHTPAIIEFWLFDHAKIVNFFTKKEYSLLLASL